MTKAEALAMFPIGSQVMTYGGGHIGVVTSIDEYRVAFIGKRVVVTVEGLGEYSPKHLVAL